MILSVFFVLAAVVAGLFLWRDLRRADEKRRRREFVRRSPEFARVLDTWRDFKVVVHHDLIRSHTEAMASAGRALAKLAENPLPPGALNMVYARGGGIPRCRWCKLLGRIGLSHHAAHYRPRHRAATR